MSSPIALKSTVLWRGEDRSLFGGAIVGADMGTMIGNRVVVGGNLRIKVGKKNIFRTRRERRRGEGQEGEKN